LKAFCSFLSLILLIIIIIIIAACSRLHAAGSLKNLRSCLNHQHTKQFYISMYSKSLARAFQKFFFLLARQQKADLLVCDEQLEFIIYYSQACSQISLALALLMV
jgi:hypothetical protein